MSADRIDVLAVMDAIQRRLDASFGHHSFPEYAQARAAVAELIEAAQDREAAEVTFYMRNDGNRAAFKETCARYGITLGDSRIPGHGAAALKALRVATAKRYRAALARVGGAP